MGDLRRPSRDDEAPERHYVTSGLAVAGLGTLGLGCAFLLHVVLEVELGFIDARAMVLVSAVFLAVGGWMIRTGWNGHEEARPK